MTTIRIFSNTPRLAEQWSKALDDHYHVFSSNNLQDQAIFDAAIVDADFIDSKELIHHLNIGKNRFLVVGNDWPEEKQIRIMMLGAAGYCDKSEPTALLVRAVDSILGGDIWMRRALVPKVISALLSSNPMLVMSEEQIDNSILNRLSSRELEVAQMVKKGETNKRIAQRLTISERTVKAHMSSIFRKLDVDDRLHLALLMKEID